MERTPALRAFARAALEDLLELLECDEEPVPGRLRRGCLRAARGARRRLVAASA